MEFLKVIGNVLLTGLIVMVLLFAWAMTVLAVYNSARNRRVSLGERVFWVALSVVLPFVGAFIYLLGRVSGVLVAPPKEEQDGRRETTEIMQGGFYGTFPPAGSVPSSPQSRRPAQTPVPVSSPRPAGLRLHVSEGPCAGSNFMLGHLPALIGRGPESAVRLDDDHRVSRRHAEIFLRDGALFLRDLGSLHGTSLNGAPLGEAPLAAGDTILVGESTIHVVPSS